MNRCAYLFDVAQRLWRALSESKVVHVLKVDVERDGADALGEHLAVWLHALRHAALLLHARWHLLHALHCRHDRLRRSCLRCHAHAWRRLRAWWSCLRLGCHRATDAVDVALVLRWLKRMRRWKPARPSVARCDGTHGRLRHALGMRWLVLGLKLMALLLSLLRVLRVGRRHVLLLALRSGDLLVLRWHHLSLLDHAAGGRGCRCHDGRCDDAIRS